MTHATHRGAGTTAPTEPVPVVLAGARGHGHWHLANLRRLAAAGRVRLVGVCDVEPLRDEELAGFDGVAQGAELGPLLERTGARVAVVCTPIHTHLPLALAAAERGAHLLLEKPPTPSLAEFRELLDGVARAGTLCQIGFQSLGSHAVTAIRDLVRDDAIGAVRGIGAAGAWTRDEAYFARAPWAGRRRLHGRDVVDGVLTNPLAHAVATALRIGGAERVEDVASVEMELWRANDIESDDTSALRVRTATGGVVTAGVTLCAERPGEPYVVVHGERGRITFWYKQDRVLLERDGHEPTVTVYPRTDLLTDLLDRLARGEAHPGLLVPPERTGAFTRVVEAVRTAPPPRPLPEGAWRGEPGERGPRRVVPGVDELVARSARTLSLFSELAPPWQDAGERAGRPDTAAARRASTRTAPSPQPPEPKERNR